MSSAPRPLHHRILVAMALGTVVGLALNRLWTPDTWAALGVTDPPAFLAGHVDAGPIATAARFLANLAKLTGDLFLRALRVVAVPMVLFSLVVGAAGLGELRSVGRIGGKAFALYLATTAFAVFVGLLLANVVQPGAIGEAAAKIAEMKSAELSGHAANLEKVPSGWQQLLELVPTNPFASLAHGAMLQVILIALVTGAALTAIPKERAAPVIGVATALTDATVVVVEWLMALAPYAVFALLATEISKLGVALLVALIKYVLTVSFGLAVILFVEYPLILRVLGRQPLKPFFRAMAPAQLLAFSSSSSNATLPVTMKCVRELGVSERITSFVCPLGATVNMDGTALMQGVATLFIAQAFGTGLDFGAQLTIVVLATLSSIGSPGVPSGGIVMLIWVLDSVGVPVQGVAAVLAVDRILDMMRTVVNVTGDAVTAVVVARSEGETLQGGQ